MRRVATGVTAGIARLAVACAATTACAAVYRGQATASSPAELRTECGATAVEGVPFIQQVGREDCGPAALAMIFAYWRIPADHQDVLAACPPAPGIGTTAKVMRGLARAHGLPAYLLHGELSDLEHELERGRPVLVGLAQPWSDATWTHYAVVVGIDRANDRVVTIDPARGWQKNTIDGFLDEWAPVGRPAMVFLGPPTTAGARSPTENPSEIAR